MSRVDTNLSPAVRKQLAEGVRSYLPYFLSKSSSLISDPLEDAARLLNLPAADLRHLAEVHFSLSSVVEEFLNALPQGLRRPTTMTDRPRVVSQQVTGPVDWGATIRLRAASGGTEAFYVTRPALRIYDSLENRALRWAIEDLDRLFQRVAGVESGLRDLDTGAWVEQVRGRRMELARSLRIGWLQSVPRTPSRPDAHARMRLQASRLPMYRMHLMELLNGFDRYLYEISPEAVAELVVERYFQPSLDWQLFEIAVAFRLAKGIEIAGGVWSEAGLLVGGAGRRPYAKFTMTDGSIVRLWYQKWPKPDSSHQRDVMQHHALTGPGSRPDIIVERHSGGLRVDLVLLELKASARPGTLAEGVLQLLGYLNDQRWMDDVPRALLGPFAWVVGVGSTKFPSAPKMDNLDVWIVSDDQVVPQVVQRMTGALPEVS